MHGTYNSRLLGYVATFEKKTPFTRSLPVCHEVKLEPGVKERFLTIYLLSLAQKPLNKILLRFFLGSEKLGLQPVPAFDRWTTRHNSDHPVWRALVLAWKRTGTGWVRGGSTGLNGTRTRLIGTESNLAELSYHMYQRSRGQG